MKRLHKVLQFFANILGVRFIRTESYNVYAARMEFWEYMRKFQVELERLKLKKNILGGSRSQLGADFVALNLFGSKGFFVEFGAANGLENSNTYLLEQSGWTGILAEPSELNLKSLQFNRNSIIDNRAVWSTSNTLLAFMDVNPTRSSQNSSLLGFENENFRTSGSRTYQVNTVSLNDLLEGHGAPEFIEFLSIDTEGSELSILEAFDFQKHQFGLIAIEIDSDEKRRVSIANLLTKEGYVRHFQEFSRWDDWYVHQSLLIR
jgi:FkbM family methyltransferase